MWLPSHSPELIKKQQIILLNKNDVHKLNLKYLPWYYLLFNKRQKLNTVAGIKHKCFHQNQQATPTPKGR